MVCLQGASAIEEVLKEFPGKPVHAFVVWEPVLPTDWGAPSTAALNRISDRRVAQYWDKDRLISKSMGERDRKSIVWDHIAVYVPGATWHQKTALFADGPVIKVLEPAREAIIKALSVKSPFDGNVAEPSTRKIQRMFRRENSKSQLPGTVLPEE